MLVVFQKVHNKIIVNTYWQCNNCNFMLERINLWVVDVDLASSVIRLTRHEFCNCSEFVRVKVSRAIYNIWLARILNYLCILSCLSLASITVRVDCKLSSLSYISISGHRHFYKNSKNFFFLLVWRWERKSDRE